MIDLLRVPVFARRALMASSALVASSLAFASPAWAQAVIDAGDHEVVDGAGAGLPWDINGGLTVGQTGSGTLTIINAGFVRGGYSYLGFGEGSTGIVTVTGAGSRLQLSGIELGYDGSGALTISDGGFVSSSSTRIGTRDGSGVVTVTGAGSAWTSGDIEVGRFGSGTLTIADGAAVTGWDGVIAYYFGSMGEAAVTGAGSAWTSSDEMYVGKGGTGTLSIAAGGAVSSLAGFVGDQLDSIGEVTVTGAGSTWTNRGDLHVGNDGQGVLTVADGGAVSSREGFIGYGSGSTGEVTVTGVGSRWTNSRDVVVGRAGDGSLTVEDGGGVSNVRGIIGLVANTANEVTVTGAGSTWTNSALLFVGAFGDGALTVENGGTVSNTTGYIGDGDGVTGAVTVTGADSVWTNSGDLYVGNQGAGTMTVAVGGAVSSINGYIGDYAGSTGSATITGAGSAWNNSGFLFVGDGGFGALTVADGGRMSNGTGYVGRPVGSTGEITVSGAGSLWTTSSQLYVGLGGVGLITVEDGGAVSSALSVIGHDAGGVGEATVTGAGSTWVSNGELSVGLFGTGALTVADGGAVSAANVSLGLQDGAVGTLNIGAAAGDAAVAAGSVDAPTIVFGDGDGSIVFNHTSDDFELGADISGAGTLRVLSGRTLLSGDNTYTGATTIAAGTLRVDGSLTNQGGLTVQSGGILGGTGGIGGLTTIQSGGTLVGQAGSVLTLNALTLGDGAILDVTLGAPAANALFAVGGDLTLDGVLDITDGGAFGVGVYGLITYGGALTDNGVEMGDVPVGYSAGRFEVQTSVAGRVNLVNNGMADLLFWDGGDPLNADNGAIDGGGGIWTLTGATWTGVDGASNGLMNPAPGLSVFMGAAGTVTLDDSAGALSVTGLQFAADGYVLTGDDLALVEESPGSGVNLRVGDGTAAGAGWIATIGSDLTGAVRLRKTDLGTLVLTGDANHTGGTEIAHGELRIGDGGVTGSLAGDVVNAAVLRFDRSDDLVFSGVVSGAGDLVQTGVGVLGLTGISTYTGATRVLAGSLDVSSASHRLSNQTALSVAAGATFELGATFQDVGSFAGGGTLSGAGGTLDAGMDDRSTAFSGRLLVSTVNLSGDGTLTLSGEHAVDTLRIANTVRIGAGGWSDLTGTDGPVVQMSGGLLDLDGNALRIETLEDLAQPGAVSLGDGGVLTLSDGRTQFRGAITGSGELVKDGSDAFTLAGDVAYDGDLTILNGGVVLDAAAVLSGDLALAVSAGAAFDLNDTGQRLTGLSGAGRVDLGAGALELAPGDATFAGDFAGTGDITLSGGSLDLNGDSSAFGGMMTIGDGASLTGSGAIGGLMTIADGGTLSGVQGQTLGLGALMLSQGSTVAAALGAAGDTALFDVAGDLTLDGDLEVTDMGGFGAGVYRLFDYGGDLTDLGLDVSATPDGVGLDDLYVQTSVDQQVNLVSTHEVDLRFWDGAGWQNDFSIQGGAGVWSAAGRDWTGANGAVNGAYDNPAFAVFTGSGGTVTVDGASLGVTGMQFAVDGYQITGEGLALTEGETIVRVGDGTAAGAGMTATIASALTGAGGLVKTDLGTLILTGTNSYAGGTVVRDGTLIGDAASIAGQVVNDATLVFDQGADAIFAGAISGGGEAFKRGAGVLSVMGANAMDWTVANGALVGQAGAFSGDVDIASGASFTFGAETDAMWGGVLSGAGTFAKTGAGDLALTGDSSSFAGLTEIRDGRLVLNGALGGELRLFDGSMLGGSGALGQLTAGSGAVIAPGNSIGTLNITGDVVFNAGSIYEVEVDPASDASDWIVAGGTATLNGGVVRHIGYAGQYRPDSSYVILTAAGGVTGTFDGVETDFAFLDSSLQYAANAVSLRLERNDVAFPAVGQTFNQRSTAAALEATGSGAALYDALIGQTAADARFAFDMLSGEVHGSIRTAQSEGAQVLASALTDRMEAARAVATGPAFWAQATGSRTRLATDGNAASLTHGAAGLMMGADADVGAVRLGLAAATSSHDYDSPARAGHAKGDSLSLAAYGSGEWGALGLKAALSGTWHAVETERRVVFPGFAEQLAADYDATTNHAFIEASWRVAMGPAGTVEPFVTLARVRTGSDAFAESGGDAALAVEDRVQSVNLATLGIGASHAFDQGDRRTAVLSGRLGWRHASGGAVGEGRHAFAGTTTSPGAFVVRGLPVAGDALAAELGLDLDLRDRLNLSVDWSAQLASDLSSNALTARLDWRF
ncbi:MAG: autotransporter outer membrane beta-barrel domain-containing protein [Pseudomonadota bacterium]|nr:autotransporter outer membrane beta-barrel domain-containing protein [Pseudomonadota bacterium]